MKYEVSKKYDDLAALLRVTDVEKPKKEDIQALRQYLDADPFACEVVGNLYTQIMLHVIDNAVPKREAVRLSIEAYCVRLRNELGYETGSTMEKMLIETVVVCWLRLYVTESRYETTMKSNITVGQGLYWEKKLSSNQRRYLRAVEALARVRRLLKEPRSPVLNMLLAQQFNQR